MQDHLGPNVGEQADEIGVDDVGLDEFEIGLALGFVQVRAAARTEIVEADNDMSVCEKAINQRRSDEPSCPRDQCAHRPTIPTGRSVNQVSANPAPGTWFWISVIRAAFSSSCARMAAIACVDSPRCSVLREAIAREDSVAFSATAVTTALRATSMGLAGTDGGGTGPGAAASAVVA